MYTKMVISFECDHQNIVAFSDHKDEGMRKERERERERERELPSKL